MRGGAGVTGRTFRSGETVHVPRRARPTPATSRRFPAWSPSTAPRSSPAGGWWVRSTSSPAASWTGMSAGRSTASHSRWVNGWRDCRGSSSSPCGAWAAPSACCSSDAIPRAPRPPSWPRPASWWAPTAGRWWWVQIVVRAVAAAVGPLADALAALDPEDLARLAEMLEPLTSCYSSGEATGLAFTGGEALRQAGAVRGRRRPPRCRRSPHRHAAARSHRAARPRLRRDRTGGTAGRGGRELSGELRARHGRRAPGPSRSADRAEEPRLVPRDTAGDWTGRPASPWPCSTSTGSSR